VTRARSSRAPGIGLTAVVLAATLLATMASPILAGPRVWFFGSPGAADTDLILSPVQNGGMTAIRIRFQNLSGQTFNQVKVLLGDVASTDSLPASALIDSVHGANAGDCTITTNKRNLTCDYGHVPKGNRGIRDITVVIDLSAAGAGNKTVIAKAEINETQGTTNLDTTTADGTTTTFAGDGDNKGNVIPAGQALKLATSSGSNGFGVQLAIDKTSDGSNALAIREAQSDVVIDCGTVTCISPTILLFADFGDTLNPEVTITYDAKSTKFGGIFHRLDDGTQIDITNDKAHTCGGNLTTNCIASAKNGVLVVRLPTNGGIRVH
jgi:hypothetical protein